MIRSEYTNKNQISTSVEQSKRLLSCGVDPETADMAWIGDTTPRLTIRTDLLSDRYVVAPAWSLSALLELSLLQCSPYGTKHDFCMHLAHYASGPWQISWKGIVRSDSLFEVCVQMIEQAVYYLNKQKK